MTQEGSWNLRNKFLVATISILTNPKQRKMKIYASSVLLLALACVFPGTANGASFNSENYEKSYLMGATSMTKNANSNLRSRRTSIRHPTWEDWEFIKFHWFERINESTCPDEGDEALKTHWDYNYDNFIAAGMNETEALQQDCELFHRFRNPRQMGSRLVRHVFHDSTGGFDGFVNVSTSASVLSAFQVFIHLQ